MRKTTVAVLAFICTVIVSEVVGFGVSTLIMRAVRAFGGPPAVKIDLQSKLGCPSGSLADLKRRFSDDTLKLERGADSLFICSDNSINTTVEDAPRALAREFPGCLNYITGALRMLRESDAICALPDNQGYICDGEKGTEGQGVDALGTQSSVVSFCTPETLTKFGFAVHF
ncbi:hypothetical protein [Pseudorhizobium flavum]|uniref:Uncharacterized protein n=1 Tax=Pseudorhizobium flavum TaxID=1335061 RepID=A0A7X0DB08_9HYPH|nr:hypothetical protein [Pseudorhizobium flavum]MBB6178307.1 hypothetical protein [Pseudorhizobium flavum]CAD6613092.1 hypothetical protein RFYW14_02550 [Pseudorhizobium flavum]